jgi:8-oxo-dGTP diphosphatase
MAYWFHIGLLVLNDDSTKFLVCEKDKSDITDQFIMPGGQMDEQSVEECLKQEIKEELSCDVDVSTLKYIGEYTDVAAGDPDHDLIMDLFQGKLVGKPQPAAEIKRIHWIGKKDQYDARVSSIIRDKIIPSLIEKGILK